ncbi:hypothetical protein OAS39_08335 [Pirellulales bacterium]|nr:hypothetical protein [Pirellulales bacterium]
MTKRPEKTPLGKTVRVGKCGYQLFREVWPNGDVRYFAEVGRPFENRQTGATGIITKCYSGAISDFLRAAQEAEPHLEAIVRAVDNATTSQAAVETQIELVDPPEREAA